MNTRYDRTVGECLKDYASAGLIRTSMMCPKCKKRMRLRNGRERTPERQYSRWVGGSSPFPNVQWLCQECFESCSVTWGSPMAYIDLAAFDASLYLWLEGVKSGVASRLLCASGPLYKFYRVFRKACGLYIRTKVLPFVKLIGPIEIGETKVGVPKKNL